MTRRILGLDLGVASLGWCLVERGVDVRIVDTGVRIFKAGKDKMGTKDEQTPNQERRRQRLVRRQIRRRVKRRAHVWDLLARADFLPEVGKRQRASIIEALEKNLLAKWDALCKSEPALQRFLITLPHVLPYVLRAEALRRPLDVEEIGRVLLHFSQRRGFLSNSRKAPASEDAKEASAIKEEHRSLKQKLAERGETLGQYLACLDPEVGRIRTRHTLRSMYLDEFEKIVAAQSTYHPALKDSEFVRTLSNALFHQLPLRSARHLVGPCRLVPSRQRMRQAFPIAQAYRVWQGLASMRIEFAKGQGMRPLTKDERERVASKLLVGQKLKVADVLTILNAPVRALHNLNDDTRGHLIQWDRTAEAICEVTPNGWWHSLSQDRRDRFVQLYFSFRQIAPFAKHLASAEWSLDPETASRLANIDLEDHHSAFSRAALTRILPKVIEGKSLGELELELHEFQPKAPTIEPRLSKLQGIDDARLAEVRNPIVTRSLSQLRKVVNAVIDIHGRPDEIHIELARDLKKNREERFEHQFLQNQERKARSAAKEWLKTNNLTPNRSNVEKWLLWEECNRTCPYSRKTISKEALFDNGEFQVEHIWPHWISGDDSFLNKTLCRSDYNARKGSRTPKEAFGNTNEWDEMLQCVREFKGRPNVKKDFAHRVKYSRFQKTTVDIEGFTSRALNDTRYAAKLARLYLSRLYGGDDDGPGRRIFCNSGGVTAILRDTWKLNSILGKFVEDAEEEGGGFHIKMREDHRQHAIDALVIALCDSSTLQQLAAAFRKSDEALEQRAVVKIKPPTASLVTDMSLRVDEMIISLRPKRRLRGGVHKATHYGQIETLDPDTKQFGNRFVTRKRLEALTDKHVEQIVDKGVRNSVIAAIKDAREKKPGAKIADVFSDEARLPTLPSKRGAPKSIRKVRILMRGDFTMDDEDVKKVNVAAPGEAARWVDLDGNHHVVVREVIKQGKPTWELEAVSLFHASKRLREGKEVVERSNGGLGRYLFHFAVGDVLELATPAAGMGHFWEVKAAAAPQSHIVPLNDAREDKRDAMKAPYGSTLMKWGARKVTIDVLGRVRGGTDEEDS